MASKGNDKKGSEFEGMVFRYCGREVGGKFRDYPDTVFKTVAMVLYSIFFFSRKKYNGLAIQLAEAFQSEIPSVLEKLNTDEAYLKGKGKFPKWKARRFAAVRSSLEGWQKALPAMINLSKAYAYIGKPWGFVMDGINLQLETPEGAAWRMMAEYAKAFREKRIDGPTGAAHGQLIMQALVTETGLISEPEFSAALAWAMGETDTFPTPASAQTVDDSDDEETAMGAAMKTAGIK